MKQIPQIIGFAKVSPEGRIRLKKDILERLGGSGTKRIAVDETNEVVLSVVGNGTEVVLEKGNTLLLPRKLEIKGESLVCFIERPRGLAVKKMDIREEGGKRPAVIDCETPIAVTRTARMFPEPEVLLQKITSEVRGALAKTMIAEFWTDKFTCEGVIARRLIGIELPEDEEFSLALQKEILDGQQDNGSFGGSTITTSRKIEDLLDLGLGRETPELDAAADWLLDQPRSPHNPGMFFLSGDLVDEQIATIEERQSRDKGTRKRFRNRPRSETRAVEAYDPLFTENVCGPRIMWPNGIIMHALLRLGLESHERIQSLIRTLTIREWCECGYQHGLADWRNSATMSEEQLAEYESARVWQFRAGGLDGLDGLTDEYRVARDLCRVGRTEGAGHDEYTVRLPTHVQSCEYMTTYGASGAGNAALRRFAESHLWRFAGILYSGMNGNLEGKIHKSLQERHFDEVSFFILKVFAEYRHPASRLGILLSVPWLAKKQNDNGSWGDECHAESATLGVVKALCSISYFG